MEEFILFPYAVVHWAKHACHLKELRGPLSPLEPYLDTFISDESFRFYLLTVLGNRNHFAESYTPLPIVFEIGKGIAVIKNLSFHQGNTSCLFVEFY